MAGSQEQASLGSRAEVHNRLMMKPCKSDSSKMATKKITGHSRENANLTQKSIKNTLCVKADSFHLSIVWIVCVCGVVYVWYLYGYTFMHICIHTCMTICVEARG